MTIDLSKITLPPQFSEQEYAKLVETKVAITSVRDEARARRPENAFETVEQMTGKRQDPLFGGFDR
jgi:hypothetical protein